MDGEFEDEVKNQAGHHESNPDLEQSQMEFDQMSFSDLYEYSSRLWKPEDIVTDFLR